MSISEKDSRIASTLGTARRSSHRTLLSVESLEAREVPAGWRMGAWDFQADKPHHNHNARIGDEGNQAWWNRDSSDTQTTQAGECPSTPTNPNAPPLRADSQVSGLVYADGNGDGQAQDFERRLEGTTVTLSGRDIAGNSVTRQASTDAGGIYMFTGLPAGTYAIQVTTPSGYTPGGSTTGAFGGNPQPNLVSSIAIPEGQSSGAYNFGELTTAPSRCMPPPPPPCSPPPPVQTGELSGIVYLDANRDGVIDDTEPRLEAVPMTLSGTDTSGNTVNQTTSTAVDGTYHFTGLAAGTYTIETVTPIGLLPGHASTGAFGGTTGVNIVADIVTPAGQMSAGYNFGMEEPRPR
jgi:SdrD B-like domain